MKDTGLLKHLTSQLARKKREAGGKCILSIEVLQKWEERKALEREEFKRRYEQERRKSA